MSATSADRRMLIKWFFNQLVQAQTERPARQGVTESGEIEWAVFEREKLFELVNRERMLRGLQGVEMEAVVRIELSAAGHFDYTRTLAIGAADLVLGL